LFRRQKKITGAGKLPGKKAFKKRNIEPRRDLSLSKRIMALFYTSYSGDLLGKPFKGLSE
jgi:hypothetical protein